MATEIVTNISNDTISLREQADEHPLYMASKARAEDDAGALTAKVDASWARLLAEQRSAATANVDV